MDVSSGSTRGSGLMWQQCTEVWAEPLGHIQEQAVSPLRSPTWHGNSVTQRVTHPSQPKPVMKHFVQPRSGD